MNENEKRAFIECVRKKLRREYVTRKEVYEATGMYSPKFQANCDSAKCGIRGRIYVSRRVLYPREEVLKWIAERITTN